MTEFAGPYADLFAHNTETALRDGKRLGDALSGASNELQKYKEPTTTAKTPGTTGVCVA